MPFSMRPEGLPVPAQANVATGGEARNFPVTADGGFAELFHGAARGARPDTASAPKSDDASHSRDRDAPEGQAAASMPVPPAAGPGSGATKIAQGDPGVIDDNNPQKQSVAARGSAPGADDPEVQRGSPPRPVQVGSNRLVPGRSAIPDAEVAPSEPQVVGPELVHGHPAARVAPDISPQKRSVAARGSAPGADDPEVQRGSPPRPVQVGSNHLVPGRSAIPDAEVAPSEPQVVEPELVHSHSAARVAAHVSPIEIPPQGAGQTSPGPTGAVTAEAPHRAAPSNAQPRHVEQAERRNRPHRTPLAQEHLAAATQTSDVKAVPSPSDDQTTPGLHVDGVSDLAGALLALPQVTTGDKRSAGPSPQVPLYEITPGHAGSESQQAGQSGSTAITPSATVSRNLVDAPARPGAPSPTTLAGASIMGVDAPAISVRDVIASVGQQVRAGAPDLSPSQSRPVGRAQAERSAVFLRPPQGAVAGSGQPLPTSTVESAQSPRQRPFENARQPVAHVTPPAGLTARLAVAEPAGPGQRSGISAPSLADRLAPVGPRVVAVSAALVPGGGTVPAKPGADTVAGVDGAVTRPAGPHRSWPAAMAQADQPARSAAPAVPPAAGAEPDGAARQPGVAVPLPVDRDVPTMPQAAALSTTLSLANRFGGDWPRQPGASAPQTIAVGAPPQIQFADSAPEKSAAAQTQENLTKSGVVPAGQRLEKSDRSSLLSDAGALAVFPAAAHVTGAERPSGVPVATLATHPDPAAFRQMAEALHRAPDGRLELTLSPEELGKLRMTLHPSDTGINVTVSAERNETMDLLRRNIEMLGQEFRDLGYRDVRFDFGPGGQQSGRQQQPAPQGNTADPAPATRIHPARAMRDGLDIRI